jgi:rhodanese-related sulfurtransferase
VEDLVHHTGRSHSSVSQHLAVLKESRLVTGRKEGLYVFYKLADPVVAEFWQLFRQVAMRCMADAREVYSNYIGSADEPSPHIHVEGLRRRLEKGDVVILDVRPVVEFRAGHIPGALSIPLEDLKQHIDSIPKGRDVVVYCRGPYCMMAREAVRILESHGLRGSVLEEGILEWRAEGNPVEEGSTRSNGGANSAQHN